MCKMRMSDRRATDVYGTVGRSVDVCPCPTDQGCRPNVRSDIAVRYRRPYWRAMSEPVGFRDGSECVRAGGTECLASRAGGYPTRPKMQPVRARSDRHGRTVTWFDRAACK